MNECLPYEERLAMVKESLEPKLVAIWKKFKYIREMLHTLALAMARMKSTDSELCVNVVKSFSVLKSVKLEHQVAIYKTYAALGEEVVWH